MAPLLKTPGGLLRWAIRDMRDWPAEWTTDGQHATQVCENGGVVHVYAHEIAYFKGDRITIKFGPLRRWRLRRAIRRLAAVKVCEVLA